MMDRIFTQRDVEQLCQIRYRLGDGRLLDFLADDEEQAARLKLLLSPEELRQVNIMWLTPGDHTDLSDGLSSLTEWDGAGTPSTSWDLLPFSQKALVVGWFMVKAALLLGTLFGFGAGMGALISWTFGS